MKVHTESGSVYEIEHQETGYRVRRLVNGMPAEDNVRASEEWRDAVKITDIIVGQRFVIGWRWREEDGVLESTLTSIVTAVLPDLLT